MTQDIPRQICQGGPLHKMTFNLESDTKTRIGSGDQRPGWYAKTNQRDTKGRRIWSYQPPETLTVVAQ